MKVHQLSAMTEFDCIAVICSNFKKCLNLENVLTVIIIFT